MTYPAAGLDALGSRRWMSLRLQPNERRAVTAQGTDPGTGLLLTACSWPLAGRGVDAVPNRR